MTARRASIAALLFALGAVVLIPPEPVPAVPTPKVVGRLGGLPPRAPAVVAAVDPNTLRVLAASRVRGKGRYELPATSQVTMLVSDVEGEVPLLAASRAFRPTGRRTRIDLTLAPTLAPAVAGRGRPLGGVEPTPAVTVDWTMTGSVDGRPTKIGSLVEADVVRVGTRRCDLTVVTSSPVRRRAVEDEVARQQTEPFDPSTTITFNPLQPSVRIRGGGTESDGRHSVSLQAIEIATGTVVAESSQSGVDARRTIDRASRELAHTLCELFPGAPAGPGGRGDPYVIVVKGTHSAQFSYRTPDSTDSRCDARDEADGRQMFMFESEPVIADVVTAKGSASVAVPPAAVLFTGTRLASYRFIRDGPACFPVTPVDTSGCGAPQDPSGLARFVFSPRKLEMTIGFPDYASCPFTPLIVASSASGEAEFIPRRLDPSGPTVFTFQDWTVTFTPAD